MRPARASLLPARDVLPAAVAEKPVVTACDERRAVFEHDAIRALDGRPLREDLRLDVAAVRAPSDRAIDGVARTKIGDRARPTVRHEHRRGAPEAVGTGMAASAIRVDRPRERHARGLRHRVEGGLGVDFVEPGVERLRRVEVAHHGLLVARQPTLRLLIDLLVPPAHEHMFAYPRDELASRGMRPIEETTVLITGATDGLGRGV